MQRAAGYGELGTHGATVPVRECIWLLRCAVKNVTSDWYLDQYNIS